MSLVKTKIFVVKGKGETVRMLPIHPHTLKILEEYFQFAGCDPEEDDQDMVLFPSVRTPGKQLARVDVFRHIVQKYARIAKVNPKSVCCHSFRVTAATNAVENGGKVEEVQPWMGHSSIATTQGYIRARIEPEDSPTFKIHY